ATLRLYVTNPSVNAADIYATTSTDWSETTITWNTRPAISGAPIATITTTPSTAWLDVDVTGKVVPGQAFAIALVPRSTDLFVFHSKEDAAHPLQLVLQTYNGTATLSWNAPTTNADGTALADLAGYKISYGFAPGNYSTTVDVGNVTTYQF